MKSMPPIRAFSLLLLLAAGCASLQEATPFNDATNRRHAERARTVDVLHYKIDLRVHVREKRIEGSTAVTFRPLQSTDVLELDAAEMEVEKVTRGAEALRFSHSGGTLRIAFPRRVGPGDPTTVTVHYRAKPKLGITFVLPDRAYPKKPLMAWTQGETEYNRNWFPCYDATNDFATSESIISVRTPLGVVSNGRLVSKTTEGDWTRFRWKQEVEHAAYLVSFVIAEFDTVEDRWAGVPVRYHVPKGRYLASDVRRCLGMTPAMMEWFSKKTGVRYPYAKYDQTLVWDFTWGGMENISATTLYQWAVFPERAAADQDSEGLVAHELAHQWFGNLVTARSWEHIWLNESFATYFEWLWFEHKYGADRMRAEMKSDIGWYFDEDGSYRRPTVCAVYTSPDDVFDSYIYPRGAWVLHMLRDLVGDEAWWKGIRGYLARHARGPVETKDFRAAMERAAGRPLGWFFDQWLYRIGYPEFTISHEWARGKVTVTVEQAQKSTRVRYPGGIVTGTPEVFRVPVEIGVGKAIHRVWLDERKKRFVFDAPNRERLIRFDPRGTILKKVVWKKSVAELIRQLKEDPEFGGRVWAAGQLGVEKAGEEAVRALSAAGGDRSDYVGAAAMSALGVVGTDAACSALLEGLRNAKSIRVRHAAIEALDGFVERKEVRQVLLELVEKGRSPKNRSAAAAALGEAGEEVYPALLKAFGKAKDDPYLAPGILKGIARAGGKRAVPLLLEQVAYGKHPWVRNRALGLLVERLEKEKDKDERVVQLLFSLVDDPVMGVRNDAIDALGKLKDRRAVPYLEARLRVEIDGRVRKSLQAALRGLRKG